MRMADALWKRCEKAQVIVYLCLLLLLLAQLLHQLNDVAIGVRDEIEAKLRIGRYRRGNGVTSLTERVQLCLHILRAKP